MLIIGVDSSLASCGVAVISEDIQIVELLTIKTNAKQPLEFRLLKIYDTICALIEKHGRENIKAFVVETKFINPKYSKYNNVGTLIKLSKVDGIVELIAAQYNLNIERYAPSTHKKTTTGTADTTKEITQEFIRRIFNYDVKMKEDEADATSVAYCYIVKNK